MKLQKLSQTGFTHSHIALVVLVVAVIGLAGGNVYQAQVKKREAARQAAQSEELAKQTKLKITNASKEENVTVPAPATEQKTVEQTPPPKPAPAPVVKKPAPAPTTKPSYTYAGISNVTHSVDGDVITLTASLPASYNGVCSFKVKVINNYSKYQYKEAALNGSTCSVTLSKATLLADSSQWIVFTNFRTNDYTVKGDHSGYSFNL